MNSIAFYKQMLSDLENDIEYCIFEISKAEFLNQRLVPGYSGFQNFDTYYSESEKEYLKSVYKESRENYDYLKKMTAHLETLRNAYTWLYEDFKSIKTISNLKLAKILSPITTAPVNIEDSDVYNETAFGEKFDWIR